MGLTSVLQIGQSGMSVSQAALQVAGNNMANASTPGFSRQTATLNAVRGQSFGTNSFIGNGVRLQSVVRHVDEAVLGRLRSAISDQSGAEIDQSLLHQIETLQNELSDTDISSGLTDFFATWDQLAGQPDDNAVRALVVQQGANLATQIQDLRQNYVDMQTQVDGDLGTAVSSANNLISQIAQMNNQIALSERGQGTDSALRDQRDQLLDQLSDLVDINTHEQPAGTVDVFVGSIPVVLGSEARGIHLDVREDTSGTTVAVRVDADGSALKVKSGRIGALLDSRSGDVKQAIDNLDQLSGALIFQVNRLHSQGQGKAEQSSVTGTYQVVDTTAALNSSDAGLPFTIENGSFLLHVTDSGTGERKSFKIDVDLDGIGTDTSLDSLAAQINTVAGAGGVTANVTGSGELQLTADSGKTLSFSDDSSGALAGLGINTYFTGKDATDIAVNETLQDSTLFLAAGSGHVDGSNGTALAISGLDEQPLDEFNGVSLTDFWSSNVEDLAVRTGAADTKAESTKVIRDNLDAQRAGVSGVNLDEESVSLIQFQQQYQASARLISMADQLTQVLLSIV